MPAMLRNPMAIGILFLALVILVVSSVVIVPETKQVVILRFEKPIRTVNAYRSNEVFGQSGAGPVARVPLIDRIVWVDKRILDIELQDQEVLSTDQLRLNVDAFARFRVVDPLKMVVTAGSEQRVTAALQPILGSALRGELGKVPFGTLLSPERTRVMDNIQTALQRTATQYGVRIVDVRIKHADLPTGSPLDSALNRMRTARQQEQLTIQAQGQRRAQVIRAEADARAAQIYAEAFNKDAEFYNFWRAMQSYRTTFLGNGRDPAGDTSIILSPNNEYLRQFRGGEAAR